MLLKRDELDSTVRKSYDERICLKLAALIDKHSCKVVHTYLPMGSEIDISPLIEDLLARGITVVTPKALRKRQMENLVLHSLTALEDGIYGTRHPANSTVYTGNYDLFIIPGLAFDKKHYRLGYGSGYYDTFLATQPNALKVGICYPFQMVDKVPTEAHDVQLDEIFY